MVFLAVSKKLKFRLRRALTIPYEVVNYILNDAFIREKKQSLARRKRIRTNRVVNQVGTSNENPVCRLSVVERDNLTDPKAAEITWNTRCIRRRVTSVALRAAAVSRSSIRSRVKGLQHAHWRLPSATITADSPVRDKLPPLLHPVAAASRRRLTPPHTSPVSLRRRRLHGKQRTMQGDGGGGSDDRTTRQRALPPPPCAVCCTQTVPLETAARASTAISHHNTHTSPD